MINCRLSVYESRWSKEFTVGGVPGLVDRVFGVHAGSRGFDSHRGTFLNNFSSPIDQDMHTQCALSWGIMVSVAVGDCSVTECW